MTNITRINKIKENIKKKIEKNKKLFLIGAITMAGLSMSQKADAQEGPYRSDCNFVDAKELIGVSTRDTRVFFSPEELAEGLKGFSAEKVAKFKNSYSSKIDDELKATPGGLIDAFVEAGFTEQEIILAANRMLGNADEKAKAGDNQIEQDIGANPSGITFTKIENKNASLEFACFNQGEIILKGSSSLNTNSLLPNVCQDELGGFRCGGSHGPDASTVIRKEKLALQDMVLKNEVYKYLQAKDNLTPAEQNFVAGFPEQLPAHGLIIDKKGNLMQKDYIERLQKMKDKQKD